MLAQMIAKEVESMDGFWKNEMSLFKQDINNFKEFWTQPIVFSDDNLMLRPTFEETETKVTCEASSNSFWTKEWNYFLQEMETVKNFLTQPVVLK